MLIAIAFLQDVITLGDYDGGVTQLHIPTGHCIWQADDHDGARYVHEQKLTLHFLKVYNNLQQSQP